MLRNRFLQASLCAAALIGVCSFAGSARAAPLTQLFTIKDATGAGVTGATIKSITIAPTSGSNVTLTGGSGNVTFATITSGAPSTIPAAAPGSSTTYNVREVGSGVYMLAFDAAVSGEAVIIPTVTKSGSDYTADPIFATMEAQRLDASVSSRSTYAGGDTPGTTTLVARVPTFPSNFPALAITSGGSVTASGGSGGGASPSDIVNALLGTELVPGLSVRRALYTGGAGIPVSEGKPGSFQANTASTGPYTASTAPFYLDTVYYRYGESAPSGTIVWTNRTYYKTDKVTVVGRTAIPGTLPN